MQHKIGIIGAGPNAAGHARYFAGSSRTKVVAIADLDLARAQQLGDETGARALTDFRDFLNEVDAVIVSSPNFLHHQHALEVVRAGKHLFCEKPLGLSAIQAQEIANAVDQANVASVVGFSTRFSAPIQTLLRRARSGDLGEIVSLGSRRLCWLDPKEMPPWRLDHQKSGGVLLEINIHELDWMLRAAMESGCGSVQSVFARFWAATPGPRRNDSVWATIGFKGGATALHEGSWSAPNPSFFREIQGTRAAAATDEWGTHVFFVASGEARQPQPLDCEFDLRAHFLDCIEGGAPVCDAAWGAHVMQVAEAIFESAQSEQNVNITVGATELYSEVSHAQSPAS